MAPLATQPSDMPPSRKSWAYLRTPPAAFLAVMIPVCLLEAFLLMTNCPGWMKWSAGAVVLFSGWFGVRGYGRRLVIEPSSACWRRGLFGVWRIPWAQVRKVGVYTPGGVGAAEYVYLTVHDRPPAGPWEIDRHTFQLQNRPGLFDALERCRLQSRNDQRAPAPLPASS